MTQNQDRPQETQEYDDFIITLDQKRINEFGQKFAEFLAEPSFIGQERLQEEAVRAVSRLKRTFKEKDRLVRSFLSLGTSGNGKTFICELMAEYVFGERTAMTKISGPEYWEEHSIAQLIGSPPGYVGFNAESRSPFPMLSPWNLFKHAYFRRVKEAAQKTKERTNGATQAEVQQVMQELNMWLEREAYITRRIQALASYVSALHNEPQKENSAPQSESSNTETEDDKKRAELSRDLENGVDYSKLRLAWDIKELAFLHGRIDVLTFMLNNFAMAARVIKNPLEFDPEIDNEAIILVDEMDKGHPAAFINIWYEITDKARITLKNGKIVDLSNAILSMTANWGDDEMKKIMTGRGVIRGFSPENPQSQKDKEQELYLAARNAASLHLPPQLFGRIDAVVVTHPHTPSQIRQIIEKIEIRNLQKLLQALKLDITIDVSEEVIDFLQKESLDKPEEGARLPRKKVEHYIKEPLDNICQTGQVRAGDAIHVLLGEENGKPRPVFTANIRNRKATIEDILKTKEAIEKVIRSS